MRIWKKPFESKEDCSRVDALRCQQRKKDFVNPNFISVQDRDKETTTIDELARMKPTNLDDGKNRKLI